MRLVYPANVKGHVPIEEFACTTGALAQHDDILQCDRCGMVSSRPTLEPWEIIENYHQVQDEAYLAEEPARRELFDWIIDSTRNFWVPGQRLLEVGSNVGLFLDVANNRGWDARGVEPSKWAVESGRERFGVDLRQGTIEELDEPAGSADVVVLLDVLEHLVDPLSSLRRLRQVLTPDGLMVLSTVNLSGLHARLRRSTWPWFIRSHLHYFSPETLHATLRLAGFRMVEWSIVPRSFHLSYIAHRAGSSQGKLGSAIQEISKAFDLKVPVGWLGDIAFVAARPNNPSA